jgi:GMP synthase (glutamine-hydrolysing)
MSHTYYVDNPPKGFEVVASTLSCEVGAFCDASRSLYGVQFHPEVVHTHFGNDILRNFLYEVCHASGGWTMENYADTAIADIRRRVGDGRVLLGLSGGVDSSVAAVLLDKAIGNRLTCLFVDHGLLRKDEAVQVEKTFSGAYDMNLVCVDASDRFLTKLEGESEPERKRKIIGEEFIRVFEEEAGKIGKVEYLAQGTIYPDVIESGKGHAAVIKSHHNVGGLPDAVDFEEIIEPLRDLFKDEVRALGDALGMPHHIVWRQPFPGPGLAIRIIGDVTREKVTTLQLADAIFREEIALAGLDSEIWQYFAVLTNMRSVGVMGDERTYDHTVALRAVTSVDGMTADWARIPYDVMEKISNRIINEVKGVNRICYDITSKPPATIEWE